jgi:hypothetical protein
LNGGPATIELGQLTSIDIDGGAILAHVPGHEVWHGNPALVSSLLQSGSRGLIDLDRLGLGVHVGNLAVAPHFVSSRRHGIA